MPLGKYLRLNWELYLLLLPGTLLVLVFKYIPMGGLAMAFQDFDIFEGFGGSRLVGFGNFVRVFGDEYFYTVFLNSLIISLLKLVWVFPLPILLAIMLNEVRNLRYKKTVQTLVYLPHFLSWSIVYGIFYALLSFDGPFNSVMSSVGLDRIPFFIDARFFRSVLVGSDAWKTVGWGTIIYLSALTAIDQELYQAAKTDGANKLQQIFHITLPGILSTVVVMLVLRLGSLLNAGLDQIFIMYNPTVYNVADIIDTYVYRKGLGQMEYSYGAAVGLFNSVISFTLVMASNYAAKKKFGRSMW
jgi:putative aldouronate transport system permease protein